ncbi:hypothetical protein ACFYY8_18635 [Streptosporangium sp. NPDC001559]|uniref:hypothetical protein n=1 Tax=Streptosporangium sp. NPDC001559 TaxID=3366187 RepID=UPI0036E35AD3
MSGPVRRIASHQHHPGRSAASDYDFPDDLIAAQRAFWEADAQVKEVTDRLPSSIAIAAGEAEISSEQHEELDRVRAARLEALDALNNHPWWGGPTERRR